MASKREAGQNVQIGLVAGQLEGAPQHGRGEEHVLDLVGGVGRGGHAFVVAGAVAVGRLHEQVGVLFIAGGGGQLVGPDEAGQIGAASAAGGEPRLGAGHIGCGDRFDIGGRIGSVSIQLGQAQATADGDACV